MDAAFLFLSAVTSLTFVSGQSTSKPSKTSRLSCSNNISVSGECISVENEEHKCCSDQFCCFRSLANSTNCFVCEDTNECCPENFCCSGRPSNSQKGDSFQWYHGVGVVIGACIFYKICCPNEEQRRRQAAARTARVAAQNPTRPSATSPAPPTQTSPAPSAPPPAQNVSQPPPQRSVTFDLPPDYTNLGSSPPPSYGFNLPPPILNVPEDLPPPPAYPGK